MQITEAAIKYVEALKQLEKAKEPLQRFEQVLKAWDRQRKFTWAGVELEMTQEVADVFLEQLEQKEQNARLNLQVAERNLRNRV
jgi:hypothetical protein